jgi:hypothetical protein
VKPAFDGMTRYFFHVLDGASSRDEDGVECESLTAARAQAASLAGQVLLEGSGRFWDGQPWSVQVTDERGLTLFELHLSATSAPATVNLGSYQKPLG